MAKTMTEIKIRDLEEEMNICNKKIVDLDNYLMQHSGTFEYQRLMRIQRQILVSYVDVLNARIKNYKEDFD